MSTQIDCVIAQSLKGDIADYVFLNLTPPIKYLEPNEEWDRKRYSLLVLDNAEYHLYTEPRFRSEHQFDAVGYYDKRVNRPEDIDGVCQVLISLADTPGVLTHSQIKTLMKLRLLIYDGSEKRIQGASYDLILDKEFLRSGIAIEEADTITINPFDYVVVGAKESVNLLRNVCGTFDLGVRLFCRGIILSNGPQIDPGYAGRLLCLLFNTSAKEFVMTPHEEFEYATIQFQTLSASTTPYIGSYMRKQKIRDYIAKYAEESISTRLFSITDMQKKDEEMRVKIDELSDKINRTAEKMESTDRLVVNLSYLGLIVALVGLSIMVGAIFYGLNLKNDYADFVKTTEQIKSRQSDMETKFKEINKKIETVESGSVKKPSRPPTSR